MELNPQSVAFERLEDESAAEFALLLAHRDTGPGRSLGTTANLVGRSESTLRRLASRRHWVDRLEIFDAALLCQVAAAGTKAAEDRHLDQLLSFRDAQHRRGDQLAASAELIMEFVLVSARAHLAEGTLLQPGQLGAALNAAARALEASGSTAGMALGVEELLGQLAVSRRSQVAVSTFTLA